LQPGRQPFHRCLKGLKRILKINVQEANQKKIPNKHKKALVLEEKQAAILVNLLPVGMIRKHLGHI
jgi:hypothetical protein